MRIRPFFWFLLALVCASVLTFAAVHPTHAPAILQVHVRQAQPTAARMTTIELHFTDPQGIPIDEAEIRSSARMTNMVMSTNQIRLYKIDEGKYGLQFNFYMAGPWEVTVHAMAPGFLEQEQTLHLEVL